MKYPISVIALLLTVLSTVHAAEATKDSLRTALLHTQLPQEKMRIYRNLADLTYETSESCGYLIELYKQAHTVGDTQQTMEALNDLVVSYLLLDKIDSVTYYTSVVKAHAPKGQEDQWGCYLAMRRFITDLFRLDPAKALEEIAEEIKSRDISQESPYVQILAEFKLGLALHNNDQHTEALPHLLTAFEIAKQLPLQQGINYQIILTRQLSRLYNMLKEPEKSIAIVKQAIELKEQHYTLFDKQKRPFYPINDFYITNYTSLLINIRLLTDKESKYYLNRLIELCSLSQNPAHKYNSFLTLNNYHSHRKEYSKALIYNDSLIYYAHKIAVYNLPSLYNNSSQLHEELGENKEALADLRKSYQLRDSLQQNDMQEKLNKLYVEYNVNKLNYENSLLEIRNKRLLLISTLILLLLVFAVCIYLYTNLKREKRLKDRLQLLKTRAEESEKLKTAFINSICHEIRTPLNGIVGFSQLLLDPTIDQHERATFPAEIKQNSCDLVSLIDSMLEIANLDVSDEKLPCTNVDVIRLCRRTLERFKASYDTGTLEAHTEFCADSLIIATHEHYLSLVIEHLLSNAYKFTEQGAVTLGCFQSDNRITISITDTGIGIPKEKHQKVFERFFKLDTYKQGGGLGLFLCKLIVGRLSGEIYIDPTYQTGTRIIVHLPTE